MAKIRRCVIKNKGSSTRLTYQPALSISIHGNGMTCYTCMGDESHGFHILRLQYDDAEKLITNTGIPIYEEVRKRVVERSGTAFCPIGKCNMRLVRGLTRKLENDNIDVYQCDGRLGSHLRHLVRITYGILPDTEIPIILVNIEKKDEIQE